MISQVSQAINLKSLKTSGLWLPLLFVLATGGLLVMFIFGVLAYQLVYLNRVYPGVLVDGVPVGGMRQARVVEIVNANSGQYLAEPITIHAIDRAWTLTDPDSGMRVDAVATANRAYAVGRRGSFIADILTHLRLLAEPYNVEPVVRYHTGPTNLLLQQLAEAINYPPEDARLVIHPAGPVELIPARRGRRLHTEATRELIEQAILNNQGGAINAVVQQIIPNITTEEAEAARQQAESLLSEPLLFTLEGEAEQWQLKPETVAGLLEVVEMVDESGQTRLDVRFNRQKSLPYLEKLAGAVHRPVIEARLAFDAEAGELKILQESQAGRRLEVEATYQQMERLLAGTASTHRVQMPVVITAPVVSSQDVDSLGIKELVSESTSYFSGSSQGRARNIALAASKFQGVVIPPGEIFSFNQTLGEVTKENGYDESLIIFGNRTTVGIGGGVCQVSTTVFRAALFSGYELLERWAHGYRVSYYEYGDYGPGLDATVYSPDLDLKFRNDTDYYLLIQTETDLEAGTLTFRFYSTDTGREVAVTEPQITNRVEHGPPIYEQDPTLPVGVVEQVDWANDGLDVTITRTVTLGAEMLHQDTIISNYQPWQAVYKVGVPPPTPTPEAVPRRQTPF